MYTVLLAGWPPSCRKPGSCSAFLDVPPQGEHDKKRKLYTTSIDTQTTNTLLRRSLYIFIHCAAVVLLSEAVSQ